MSKLLKLMGYTDIHCWIAHILDQVCIIVIHNNNISLYFLSKTATPEPGQAQSTDNDGSLQRDKKERRSRRKKRRNSEPLNKVLRTVENPSAMTKLQRGQRQVKGM